MEDAAQEFLHASVAARRLETLLRRAATGEEFVLSKAGQRMVKLVPYANPKSEPAASPTGTGARPTEAGSA